MALIEEKDDDEIPQLSAGALDALKEFYGERDGRQRQFEDLKAQAEDEYEGNPLTMEPFTEDWNASQFWYNDATATALAEQLLDGATNDSCIAVVSAPSVFIQLKNIVNSGRHPAHPQMYLLEYDERFAVFKKEFVFYDFEHPMRLPGKKLHSNKPHVLNLICSPADLKGKFNRIICDPPFLSADCQTKGEHFTESKHTNAC
ncbi:Protein-lysine N-methyltransferase efm5 [Cryomyces antarcticus]|nr:Protein-lysine N-methyltransferase efm5 [Cryomyces antarcticus]